jgi:Cu2+-exporting ATPase
MVQVVAARRLFENGVMVKDGGALERIAEIDTVIFDKTGTLTMDRLRLVDRNTVDRAALTIAASIAAHSRHPYSKALAAAGRDEAVTPLTLSDVSEHPGAGLQASIGATIYKLGRPDWALTEATDEPATTTAGVVLSENGRLLHAFHFDSDLRPDVREAVIAITGQGCRVEIMSGDRDEPVRRLASDLGLPYRAGVSPGDKTKHIVELTATGRRVLMVGDGLNDTPAFVAAHASMAPATAADVGRNAADLVFLHDSLLAVPQAIAVARDARQFVRQNLILAVGYNAIAVPIAILGYVTPLVAAVAMSASSLLVIANALRLSGWRPGNPLRKSQPVVSVSTQALMVEKAR